MEKPKIFVITIVSGGGNSSFTDELIESFDLDDRPEYLATVSILATNRPPKPGEVDGRHYFFKTNEQFQSMISKSEFAEYFERLGYQYGLPRGSFDELLVEGVNIVIDLDAYRKVQFDKAYPDAVGILILPPSMDEMEIMLNKLRGFTKETTQLRLVKAADEIEFARKYGKYSYTIDYDYAGQADYITSTKLLEIELPPV